MFNNLRRATGMIFLAMLAAGCASGPGPQFIGGNYFMTGDSNCQSWRAVGERRIMCYDSAGQYTGGRWAMGVEEMQMHQQMQAQSHRDAAALSASMVEATRSFNQSSQQMLQQSSGWTPPAVNSYTPGGSNQIRCINAGIYTNCRY